MTDLFDIKNLVLSQSPSRILSDRVFMRAHSFREIGKFKVLFLLFRVKDQIIKQPTVSFFKKKDCFAKFDF